MSDKPKTSGGLPEDPDLAAERDEANAPASPPPSSDTESNNPNPGPHQEQGGMHS